MDTKELRELVRSEVAEHFDKSMGEMIVAKIVERASARTQNIQRASDEAIEREKTELAKLRNEASQKLKLAERAFMSAEISKSECAQKKTELAALEARIAEAQSREKTLVARLAALEENLAEKVKS